MAKVVRRIELSESLVSFEIEPGDTPAPAAANEDVERERPESRVIERALASVGLLAT